MLCAVALFLSQCEKKDSIPPTVEITSPTNGAVVSGTVLINVNATDNKQIDSVEFYIDGSKVVTDTATPWEYSWNTAGLTDSTLHSILVRGYDPAENMASDSIQVLYWTNNPPNTPTNPSPATGATNQSTALTFAWHGGDPDSGDVATYAFYLSTDSMPSLYKDSITDTTYQVDTLHPNTQYYWQIIAHDMHGSTTQGPVWNFTTKANQSPNTPSNPSPTDNATDQPVWLTLSWTGGDPDAGDTVKYDVYLGTETSPSKIASNQEQTSYPASGLDYNKTYYWKVVARDNKGDTTAGPVWRFTTFTQPQEVEIIYDDDIPESGWSIFTQQTPGPVADNRDGWCMKMTPPSYPFTLTKVKFYFFDAGHSFYLHVWDDNSGGAKPGTQLLHTPFLVDSSTVIVYDWWIQDIAAESVVINSGDFYVGFCYAYMELQDDPTVMIGADSSAPFDDRAWINLGQGWKLFSSLGADYKYDLMIRAVGYIGGKGAPRKEIEISAELLPVDPNATNVWVSKHPKK